MESKNLPAIVGTQTFALTTGVSKINPALLDAIDESDVEGYEQAGETLPIVSIRQKDLLNEKGKVIAPLGNWRIYDAVSEAAGLQIPDISGEVGLRVTVLRDQSSRVYFKDVSDAKPTCKSLNGINGEGTPGGVCATCELAQWGENERPKCTSQMNVLVFDHALKSYYVLRLGRSGLKPYNNFKAVVKRQCGGAPLCHAFVVDVTTEFKADPKPHYVPRFTVVDDLGNNMDVFAEMKKLRQMLGSRLETTATVSTDEEPTIMPPTTDPGGDLPPGVEPVGKIQGHAQVAKSKGGNEDLPF